jgi:Amt family ammonium transporter
VTDVNLANNLWVLLCGLLIFLMTVSVGLLEIGELGENYSRSLLRSLLITGSALFFMAFLGFNTAFAPTIGGIIGNPFYRGGIFLGGFSSSAAVLLGGVWWSAGAPYSSTGLTTGTYFLFEAASAAVTLALVGVIVLKKMKLEAFLAFSVVYFVAIWNLPAAWIWNPTGWLYLLGARDFAGGLVVHGAAGAAGLAIVYRIWREEKAKGLKESVVVPANVNPTWLTLAMLLLWVGWFGFNPGSVLAINSSATTVVLTTFLAAAAALLSIVFFRYVSMKKAPDLLYSSNGILMGLIVITPLAGFVSPASAALLGIIAGPLYLAGERWFAKRKWFSDPISLFPAHLVGGIFGLTMIAFFTQNAFAAASGNGGLPSGLLFGGGLAALNQLGLEALAAAAALAAVFVMTYVTIEIIARAMHGITTDYKKEGLIAQSENSS